jgi:hypothetical protein
VARLTRYPRTGVDDGAFHATGSLEGMRTPRGPVYSLDWRRGASGLAALEPLTALTELDDLILEHASGVRLEPLAKLPLRGLQLRWISDTDLAPLASLPHLTHLDVQPGVYQAPGRPSPFEPPFEGLPSGLELLRIDAPDPESTKARLHEHLDGRVSVDARKPRADGRGAWTPFRSRDGYAVYGSLADLAGGRFETEYEALEDAQRRVGAADPVLLARLDFDSESSGTGISAATREDLEAVLRILSAP